MKTLCFLLLSAALLQAQTATPAREHNLLRNSRLVSGLPSGWTITGRNNAVFSPGDDYTYGSDPGVPGPTGYPAFFVKLTNKSGVPSPSGLQKSVFLYSEPFKVDTNGDYTASVYVMGTGEGELSVRGEKLRKAAAVPVSVYEEQGWTRFQCTFKASTTEKLYTLCLEIAGQVYLDSFQVNPGSAPQDYASEYPAEVALSPKEGPLSSLRMQYEDEPALVCWTVTGAEAGSILKGKVVDLNGATADLPPVPLTDQKLQTGEWNYALPALDKLGQFRIETWLENPKGDRISDFNELVMTRIRHPHYENADAPNSPFGIHLEPTVNEMLMAKALGLNWVRLHDAGIQLIGWAYLEQKPDQWVFYDKEVNRFRDHKLLLFGEVGTAPSFRSRASKTTSPALKQEESKTVGYFAPLDNNAYADYVRRVVEHYGDRIHYFDVWNEPWSPLFYSVDFYRGDPPDKKRAATLGNWKDLWYINSETAPEDFAKLQKSAFDAIKKANPEALAVGLNTHGAAGKDGRFDGDVWTSRVAAAGGLDSLDIAGFHHYPAGALGFPGDAVSDAMAKALGPVGGVAKLNQQGHPVWMTEGSPVNRQTRSGFYHYTLPYKDAEDCWVPSDRVVRYMVRLLAEGTQRMFLYSMDAATTFGEIPRARILVNEDGYPHPMAAAASNTTWHLEDTKFRTSVEAPDHQSTAYVFDGQESSVVVLIPRPAMPVAIPHPEGLTVEDIFGNQPKADSSKYSLFLRGPRGKVDGFLQTLRKPAGA